jgi:hypothetical protein
MRVDPTEDGFEDQGGHEAMADPLEEALQRHQEDELEIEVGLPAQDGDDGQEHDQEAPTRLAQSWRPPGMSRRRGSTSQSDSW